mmetsp:Transcript_1018/g.2952  ORF Transcript_1018/g.2952 Transcript_1018/m.2952 type:complete len:354 (+) Transcript_1018:85-1146(+)|eukprot:CAMPEP_0202080054 /NCGR_PEP_ID=MMETSP0964-20121228/6825_1 /ASSEMBLY_ACC=CAM_ASM_000500 /TAXON_ID=4773 /ORGANISM="Schizochytrium aggregatum, Strain ATCC28209" /LENGTH=353 /DNA_ID=CAMNT_0048647411 /DNA_START=63 /DNA_END=1124 /DNA_ORIENTATION=-
MAETATMAAAGAQQQQQPPRQQPQRAAARRPTLLDGGLGTALEAGGHALTEDTLWSARLLADAPDVLVDAHAAFLAAGAEVVTTATYQFSFDGYAARGVQRDAAAGLLRRGVELGRQACARHGRGQVAASLGSYGAVLSDGAEFTGVFDRDEAGLVAFHTERLAALLEGEDRAGWPDLLAFETVPCLVEVRAICKAVSAVAAAQSAPLPPAWLSVSCRSGEQLNSGDAVADAARVAAACPQIKFFGINCSAPAAVSDFIRVAEPLLGDKEMVIYPNRGEVFANREWQASSGATNEAFCDLAKGWLAQTDKIAYLGGCCRMGTDAIEALSAMVASDASAVDAGSKGVADEQATS